MNIRQLCPCLMTATLLFLSSVARADNWLETVRANVSDERFQIVLDMAKKPVYTTKTLNDGKRLAIAIEAMPAASYRNTLDLAGRGITALDVQMDQDNQIQLIINLSDAFRHQVKAIGPRDDWGHRMIINIFDGDVVSSSSAPEFPAGSFDLTLESFAGIDLLPSEPALVERIDKDRLLIMIDPGHGGRDSGSVTSEQQLKEKDMTLSLAKRLKEKLQTLPNVYAVLTRSTDRPLSVRGRLWLAETYRPDIFVSLQANAKETVTDDLPPVYVFSNDVPSSPAAEKLARKENAVDLAHGVDIGDYAKTVSDLLLGKQAKETIQASHSLAVEVSKKLNVVRVTNNKSVGYANFAVLKAPKMASVLVDTGSLSPLDTQRNTTNDAYQDRLAIAIATGIWSYAKPRWSRKN